MTPEYKLKRVNEFKLKGFKITLAKHPYDKDRLHVVAVKGEQVIRLFAETPQEAVKYIKSTE